MEGEAETLALTLGESLSLAVHVAEALVEGEVVVVVDCVAVGEALGEVLRDALALVLDEPLVVGALEIDGVAAGERESDAVGEGEAATLDDGSELAEGVEEVVSLAVTLAEGDSLGVVLGVPLHTHKPSAGEPQERRQQSAGQGVGELEAVGEGVWLGAVPDAVGVEQAQTMLGKAPVHCQLSPTQGETEGETLRLELREGLTVSWSVRVGDTVREPDRVAVAEGEELDDDEGVDVLLAEGEEEVVALDVVVGVPWQMHVPSAGAPQARRQQSCGQGVLEDEGEALAVCVGAVWEADGVTHWQIVLGKAPEHCQLPPTQPETEDETVVLALRERVVVAERLSVSEPVVVTLAETEEDSEGLGVVVAVPRQMQKLSIGAPQERRQHSCGQGVEEGVGEALDVCVGAVSEAVGVTHWQIVFGQAPEHSQFPPTQPVTEDETVVLALRERLVVAERLSVRVTEGEELDDDEDVDVMLEEDVSEGEMLDVMVGVPSQMQTLSLGAPQERRQQSCGQAVPEGDGETLAVCVGAVCEAVGVTHWQIVLGQAPEHSQLPPTQPVTEDETVALMLRERLVVAERLSVDEADREAVSDRVTEAEELDDDEDVDVMLVEDEKEGEMLDVLVGVPWHTQTLSKGAPQDCRQHSCGQAEPEGDGETLAV